MSEHLAGAIVDELVVHIEVYEQKATPPSPAVCAKRAMELMGLERCRIALEHLPEGQYAPDSYGAEVAILLAGLVETQGKERAVADGAERSVEEYLTRMIAEERDHLEAEACAERVLLLWGAERSRAALNALALRPHLIYPPGSYGAAVTLHLAFLLESEEQDPTD